MGKLEVHDGDKGDSVSLHLRGPYARIFKVSNDGNLILDDLTHLNHTEAHFVAVARDSGSPPRETSVPVVVRFEDQLTQLSHQSRASENEKFTLTVVLGLLLTVFLIIISGLVIYICKDKKRRKSANSPSPSLDPGQDPRGLWASSSSQFHQAVHRYGQHITNP